LYVASDSKKPSKAIRLLLDFREHIGSWWRRRAKKGPIVTEENALGLSDILTCVRVLAESLASLPLDLYKRGDQGGEKAREHPLFELLRWQPNPEMTSYDLRLWMWVDMLLRGTGCAQVIRDAYGEVLEIWPLMRSKLTAMRTPGGELVFKYPHPDRTGGEQKYVYLEADEVLLIKSFASPGVFGPSLVDLAVDLLTGAKAAENYTREFFTNGSAFSGTVELPEVMEEEVYERFKKDWHDAHSGEGGRHKTPILEGGATFKPFNFNHQEAQLLESRKFTRSQIAGVWRVPAHLINDLEKATFSNIEQQDLGLVKHTLRPHMCNLEQRGRMTLLTETEKQEGYFLKHNTNDMLKGDLASRMEAYGKGIQNGVYSPNVVLRKEDEPTYAGGDTHFINGNMLPVDVAASKQTEEVA
jgi:HK97 family phage portal protein